MPDTARSLVWSDAQMASRRRCRGICRALEDGGPTPQDAVDPPLRYPARGLSEDPSFGRLDAADLTGRSCGAMVASPRLGFKETGRSENSTAKGETFHVVAQA